MPASRDVARTTTATAEGEARGAPRSSDRVLSLLAAVVDEAEGQSLTELSRAVGLAASTATRQLASLEAAGFVHRGQDGYGVGPTMVRLAHRVVSRNPLPRLAQPLLDGLAVATGETVYLAVAVDAEVATYLAAADGTHHLRHTGWRGRQVPRIGTAVGRALAGEVSVRRDVVEAGVTAVSAPVVGHGGDVVAAVSLVGPTFRLGDGDERIGGDHGVTMRAAVTTVAGELARLLGAPEAAGTRVNPG